MFCIFAACSTEGEGPNSKSVDYETILLPCLIQEDTEFVIGSEEQYFQMVDQLYGGSSAINCVDTTAVPFDFTKYLLLGKYTQWDENDEMHSVVLEYPNEKRVIYHILYYKQLK